MVGSHEVEEWRAFFSCVRYSVKPQLFGYGSFQLWQHIPRACWKAVVGRVVTKIQNNQIEEGKLSCHRYGEGILDFVVFSMG